MRSHKTSKTSWIKLLPILFLLAGLGLFFFFHLYRYLSLESIKAYRFLLLKWVEQAPLKSALIFIVIYILAVSFSVPNAVLLTILGGFLFGPIYGSIYVIVSATIGATIIFLAAKTALHAFFYKKIKTKLPKISKGFEKNAASYLLFLRLVPLFPFWFVNVVPAFFEVPVSIYIMTTFLGIIPASIVYTFLGSTLRTILILGQFQAIDLKIIFQPTVLIPLVVLGILSLIPIILKWFKKND